MFFYFVVFNYFYFYSTTFPVVLAIKHKGQKGIFVKFLQNRTPYCCFSFSSSFTMEHFGCLWNFCLFFQKIHDKEFFLQFVFCLFFALICQKNVRVKGCRKAKIVWQIVWKIYVSSHTKHQCTITTAFPT